MNEAEIIYANSSTALNNIKYISGFTAPDPFLFIWFSFLNQKKGILIVSEMEKGRAQKETKRFFDVYTPAELVGKKGQHSFATQLYFLAKKHCIKKYICSFDFPVSIAKELEKKGIPIKVRESFISSKRRRKSKAEIEHIKYVQQAAARAMRKAIRLIQTSTIGHKNYLYINTKKLTSEMVKMEAQKELLKFNCSCEDIIVAGGNQAIDPHERGSGPLCANQSIIIDIFPRHHQTGYWGDITRTVCRGEPNEELKRLYKAVYEAQKKAISMTKPGALTDDIHEAVCRYFVDHGYENKIINRGRNTKSHVGFIHGTGHGVGLDIHESPRIGRSGDILQIGDVVTIEPGLYYPSLGGIRIEDTIAITKQGKEVLSNCAKFFILK